MNIIIIFFILIEIKHFVCDYPLQNKYMLGKFKEFPRFIMPLFVHCLVHAIGTYIVLIVLGLSQLWWLVLVDLITHFVIDRVKADKKLLGRWQPSQSMFWTALGLDQYCHHVVHVLIALIIIKSGAV